MAPHHLTRGLVRLLALTCAVTAANLYYAQPLLHTMALDFHTSQSTAGLIVTVTQFGYALGLLLLVPVGDIVSRRPLFIGLLLLDAVTLAASALAGSLAVLGALALLIGVSSVVVQMIVPYAATLARDDERARVIGTIMGGLLFGILLSRTFSGLIAAASSWRTVYGVAAALMVVTAVVIARTLPSARRELSISYAAQMRGVLDAVRTEPILRWRAAIGACNFAAFSVFWTTVAFLLAGPRYHFSQLGIGLFALVGAAGALVSISSGRVLDARPHHRWPATGVVFVLAIASFALIDLGGHSLAALIAGVLLMDACVQATHLVNQSIVYELLPAGRSRIASVYMTTYFLGGALGSALGAQAYDHWGWNGASVAAGLCCLAGLLGWAVVGRHERSRSASAGGLHESVPGGLADGAERVAGDVVRGLEEQHGCRG
jgi:predicted MFS family arabinose efflux permease